jgi:hypothetical protein
MRQKKPWEIREEELLEMENAYLEKLTPFQKLVDNHWTFVLSFSLTLIISFGTGLGIGFVLWLR